MRKLCGLLLLVVIFIMSTACSYAIPASSEKIISPLNRSIPLKGQWQIEKCLTKNEATLALNNNEGWIGKTVEFTDSTALVGEHFWDNIRYKVKRVNAEEYFLYKYKGPIESLGITEKEIFVVTVSSKDKYLYEFVKLSESRIIAYLEDEFFQLSKVSEKVSGGTKTEATKEEYRLANARLDNKLLRSGILLGIRKPASGITNSSYSEIEDYNYKTIWVSAVNKGVRPVLEADDLFLPRRSGFWKVEVKKTDEIKRTEDILLAYSISDINSAYQFIDSLNPSFWNNREGVQRKKILYVGNDYISVECTGKGKMKGSTQTWQENSLHTMPVDKLSFNKGIKISDIAGENGSIAMTSAIEDLQKTSNAKGIQELPNGSQDTSFALFRRTGHWVFKGRINYKPEDPVPYVDFNINLIPSSELVAYDTLHLPWTTVKNQIPQATDIFTSPNKDIAVVVTAKQLLVYALEGDRLSREPLQSIEIQEGDAVVMAEWALGEYMESWEKTFVKNNATRQVEAR